MSLKDFHVVFVTVCTLLCIFLSTWSFFLSSEKSIVTLVLGSVGIIGTLIMPIYGVCFYRKLAKSHI